MVAHTDRLRVESHGHCNHWYVILLHDAQFNMSLGVTNGLKDADAYEVDYRLYVFPYLRRRIPAKQE
jgi:hypothetical protein